MPPSTPFLPASDAMLTMVPVPSPSIPSRNARVTRYRERTFTLIVLSQSSSERSESGLKRPMPALLTTIRGVPRSRPTKSANAVTHSGSDTSHGMPIASIPSARSARTVASTLAAVRAHIATRAPARPRANAVARPMPSVAPVITASEPGSSIRTQIYDSHGVWRGNQAVFSKHKGAEPCRRHST